MDRNPSPALQALLAKTTELVDAVIEPQACEVDREGRWPAHSMRALAGAGLTGLQVPQRLGGHGQGLLALSMMTEAIARACPSSALPLHVPRILIRADADLLPPDRGGGVGGGG